MKPKGKFIAFEGPDGAGKTTALRSTAAWLSTKGIDVVTVKDPGTTAFGEAMRAYMLQPGRPPCSPVSEMLVFQAVKLEMYGSVIMPALQDGKWVLSDRYAMSTAVYQGWATGMDVGTFMELQKSTAAPDPDLYVVLTAAVADLEARMDARAEKRSFYESQPGLLAAVAAGFENPGFWTTAAFVKARTSSITIDELQARLQKSFEQIFPELREHEQKAVA